VFGLIGSSFGSKLNIRATKSQGFGLSVILILFYYVLSFVSNAFGVKASYLLQSSFLYLDGYFC
tara:strand:+ start:465 stop:656 length:192 start_codon:yes stop_codon:yes gene_type:complete